MVEKSLVKSFLYGDGYGFRRRGRGNRANPMRQCPSPARCANKETLRSRCRGSRLYALQPFTGVTLALPPHWKRLPVLSIRSGRPPGPWRLCEKT